MERIGEIVMYQTADGQTSIDVTLENETVWLSQTQISKAGVWMAGSRSAT